MLDGCGRDIRYVRISVTDLCNLGCVYCKPRPVPKLTHDDVMSVDEIIALANDFVNAGFTKIRLTGGEPLVRKGIIPIVKGVCSVTDNVGLTTNGILLSEFAEELKAAGLKGVNVSLDTPDPEAYRKITGGGKLSEVFKGIDAAKAAELKIKLNAVLQRGINFDPLPLLEYAEKTGAELRMIELMPFASTLGYVDERALNAENWLRSLGAEHILDEGKTSLYRYRGHELKVIAPLSRNFCAECDRIRVTCTGMLLPCLHGAKAYPVRDKIGSAGFADYLGSVLKLKPPAHGIGEGIYQKIDMGSIGG